MYEKDYLHLLILALYKSNLSLLCCSFASTRLRKVLCDSTESRARVLKKAIKGHSWKEVKTKQIVNIY